MEALRQASDTFLNTDESEKTQYDKRVTLHKQAMVVSKWVDMFSPNDISLSEHEFTKLKPIKDLRSRSICKARNFRKNKSHNGIFLNMKKFSNEEYLTKNSNKGIFNHSTDSIQRKNSANPEGNEDLIHQLPSVKNINKSFMVRNMSRLQLYAKI